MLQKVEDHRRKWDKDEFERIAKERLDAESDELFPKKDSPVKRELLKPRDYKVGILNVQCFEMLQHLKFSFSYFTG